MNRQIDMTENITFIKTTYAGSKKVYLTSPYFKNVTINHYAFLEIDQSTNKITTFQKSNLSRISER